MTPLPKKKHARSRTKTRKAAISLKISQLVNCPKCNALKLPHRKCPSCGFYKDFKSSKAPEADKPKDKSAEAPKS